jgi:hypothetical protein
MNPPRDVRESHEHHVSRDSRDKIVSRAAHVGMNCL